MHRRFSLKCWFLGLSLIDEERENLRAAIAAQAVEDSARDVEHSSIMLLDVLGQNHDIGNSLAAARVNADWLHLQTRKDIPNINSQDLRAMSIELRDSLERLQRILTEGRRLGRDLGPQGALHEVNLTTAIKNVTQRWRGVVIDLDIPKNVHVLVRGGDKNLQRVIENLVKNGFEGNGERGAKRVEIRAKNDPVGHVTIDVADDGPGFLDAVLHERINAFNTTKKNTGLGLYTVERLVGASGGQLTRANRADGGALVRVVLAKGGSSVAKKPI